MMMHQSQFIEMFKDAPRKNLGDLVSFINGSAFKPEEWSLSGLPIVRIQNLTQEDAPFNYYEGDSCSKIKITDGDILVSWSATLGVFTWDKGEALLNQHIFKVVFNKEDIDKEFFIYTVKVALETMGQFAHGSTMRHVIKKDFDNTQVAFPTKEKQVSFSNIVKQADKSKFDSFNSQFSARNYFPMYEIKRQTKITEAICRQADGSRTDGKKGYQLPFPVMRFDVNFPAADHSEVTSDTDSFTRLFLTDYCKALSNAFNDDMNFHNKMIDCYLRALGGLHSSTPSVFFQKNRVSISLENKYPVVIKHRELASSQPLKIISSAQSYNLFGDLPAN